MKRDKTICDPTLLNGFFDEELAPHESARVTEHLRYCPDCQNALRDNESISAIFKASLDKELSHANLEQVEEGLLDLIRTKRVPWWPKLRDTLLSKKCYIPVAATVTALVLFFALSRHPASVSGPSAIISSFEGDVGSVMILETSKSQQTILWFNEPSISADDEGGPQENRSAV